MKKLVKWTLILGIVLCFLGTGVMTAGAVMGGIQGVGKMIDRGGIWRDHWQDYMGIPGGAALVPDVLPLEPDTRSPVPDAIPPEPDAISPGTDTIPPELEPIPSAQETPQETLDESWLEADELPGSGKLPLEAGRLLEGVYGLDLELAGNRVELRQWEELEEGQIWLYQAGDQKRKYQIYQKDGVLEAEPLPSRQSPGSRAESLVIFVPEGWVFREVKVENAGGSFQADRMPADRLSLETMGGKTCILGGSVRTLDLECQAGETICQAVVSEGASVECDAGEVSVVLAGEEELYDYSLECHVGSIAILGRESRHYQGLDVEKNLENGTGRKVDLECDAGAITVVFQEPVV